MHNNYRRCSKLALHMPKCSRSAMELIFLIKRSIVTILIYPPQEHIKLLQPQFWGENDKEEYSRFRLRCWVVGSACSLSFLWHWDLGRKTNHHLSCAFRSKQYILNASGEGLAWSIYTSVSQTRLWIPGEWREAVSWLLPIVLGLP